MLRPPHGRVSKGGVVVGEPQSIAGMARKGFGSETETSTAAVQAFERLLSEQFRSQVSRRGTLTPSDGIWNEPLRHRVRFFVVLVVGVCLRSVGPSQAMLSACAGSWTACYSASPVATPQRSFCGGVGVGPDDSVSEMKAFTQILLLETTCTCR